MTDQRHAEQHAQYSQYIAGVAEVSTATQVWLAEVVGNVGDDDVALRVERQLEAERRLVM